MIIRVIALMVAIAHHATAQPLADAVEQQDQAAITKLISERADPAASQADGMTALHWAVQHNDLKLASVLIDAGAPVEATNRYGITPLTIACQNGEPALAELLLKNGANPKHQHSGGETVLMTAARTGRIECVKLLVQNGAGTDQKGTNDQTALMWAAASGHTDVVEFLLAKDADFKTPLKKSGFTPLLFAVRQGHWQVADAIIKAGADVNQAAQPGNARGRAMRTGTSPLMLAIENGHFDLALQLLKAGADPNDQRTGFTPLHALTWVRKAVRGDGINGIPPPVITSKLDSLDMARALVKHGAKVNTQLKRGGGGRGRVHKRGATAFLMAAETCDLDYLKTLHELGADPTLANTDETLPIIAAAGLGVTAPGEEAGDADDAIETIEYLLELGADINTTDKNGETVMHAAAYKCAPKVIHFLNDHGADISVWNRKNKGNWTPLMIAQGFRPGNFRPIAEVVEAVSQVMLSHGISPPPPPKRKAEKNY